MAYKLLALDLDDTLFDSGKDISPANREAVLRAMHEGVRVILASGRAFEGVHPCNVALGNHDYTICCGGAQVLDDSGNLIYDNCVPPHLAKQVMQWATDKQVYYQLYFNDGYYYTRHTPYTDLYAGRCNYAGTQRPDLMQIEEVRSAKILMIETPENVQKYKRELSDLFPDLRILTSQCEYLEVMHPQTSKGNALAFLAQHLGIDRSEIIAIGDSEIDAAMLEYAGLGVAVENAVPSIKQIADVIVPRCDQDGVAYAIQHYL